MTAATTRRSGTTRGSRPGRAAPGAPATLAALDQTSREGLVAFAVAAGGAAVLAMWWSDTSPASVHGVGPWLTAAGRVTGLVGTYLIVVGVLLMGRVAWLDRLIGMDRLAVWHRRTAEYSVSLLVAHGVLTIWGYGLTAHESLLRETRSVVLTYPDMLAATVGLLLMVGIAGLSLRAVRRRVSYHTWYFVHMYTYVALALSFAHQFATGVDFATHPLNRAAWIVLYAGVGALLLSYRVIKPLRDHARYRLQVAEVAEEGPGVTSVYLTGRNLDRLTAESGQFFMWRFLTRSGWWQAHPYSLSEAPNGKWLRITVKDLGDHSVTVPSLPTGTKVIAEGPYGAFTAARRRGRKVLLIGGGVGITPLRAMFQSLPGRGEDLTLLYRARRPEEIIFKHELDELAAARGASVQYLVGSRHDHPEYLTAMHLRSIVPDVTAHDVYVCGPPGLEETVGRALAELGVPRRRIHTEKFEL